MRFCSNCGTKLGDDDKFCMNCGTPVEQSGGNQQESITEEAATKETVEESTATEETTTEEAAKTEEATTEEVKTEEVKTEAPAGEKVKVSLEKKEEASQSEGYQINTGANQSEGYQINTGGSQTGPVQQAEPMNAKTKKQLAVIGACILIVVIAVVVVVKTVIFPGYKTPVKNLAKAIDKQKEKYVEDNVPKAYKALKENADMDYDELFTLSITKGNRDFAYDDIKKAEYKIVEKKKVSEKRAKAMRNQLRDSMEQMGSDKKISFDTKKCYALAVEFKLDNGDDKETFETVVYTAKSDGKWILLNVKNVDLDNDNEDEE